jgi:hypothetical protein
MSRFFNTEGVVDPARHFCVDPLARIDLPRVLELIDQQKYFVLHAPRQTGKTTLLKALVAYLTEKGRHRACYINVELAQAARDHLQEAFLTINRRLVTDARESGEPRLEPLLGPLNAESGATAAFGELLIRWAQMDPRPLVLFFDEVDALVGDTLIALLRALRAGYDKRPRSFPASAVLCGVRDVRDYRLFSSAEKTVVTGGSAFNIKSESLRLGDLSRPEVDELLSQHTRETGQPFLPEAVQAVWDLSAGQPWLVNALAFEACFRSATGKDRTRAVDRELIDAAKEALIARRDCHLDQLADKLREDRVRRIVQPILLGDDESAPAPDDLQYCVDLGLVRRTALGPAIANPIYREVIPRELTLDTQEYLKVAFKPDWVLPDGRLDFPHLLASFQAFYREHGDSWAARFDYKEAGHQLLLQAFLQRVVNGSGVVEREYALGSRRADLLIRWKHAKGEQRLVLELKVLRKSLEKTLAEGMAQLWEYAERCAADEAHLILFNKRPRISARQRFFRKKKKLKGRSFAIWGL